MKRLLFCLLLFAAALLPRVANAQALAQGGKVGAVAASTSCTQWGGYPWVQGGCLNAADINAAFDNNWGLTPPQNAFGQGPQQGKYWVDTSTGGNTPTLRQCINPAGCSATFLTTDWLTLGTYNLSQSFFTFSSSVATSTFNATAPLLYTKGTLSLIYGTEFTTTGGVFHIAAGGVGIANLALNNGNIIVGNVSNQGQALVLGGGVQAALAATASGTGSFMLTANPTATSTTATPALTLQQNTAGQNAFELISAPNSQQAQVEFQHNGGSVLWQAGLDGTRSDQFDIIRAGTNVDLAFSSTGNATLGESGKTTTVNSSLIVNGNLDPGSGIPWSDILAFGCKLSVTSDFTGASPTYASDNTTCGQNAINAMESAYAFANIFIPIVAGNFCVRHGWTLGRFDRFIGEMGLTGDNFASTISSCDLDNPVITAPFGADIENIVINGYQAIGNPASQWYSNAETFTLPSNSAGALSCTFGCALHHVTIQGGFYALNAGVDFADVSQYELYAGYTYGPAVIYMRLGGRFVQDKVDQNFPCNNAPGIAYPQPAPVGTGGAWTPGTTGVSLYNITLVTWPTGNFYIMACSVPETITVGGTIVNGDSGVVTITPLGSAAVPLTIPIVTADTTTTVAGKIVTAINGNGTLNGDGITATNAANVVTVNSGTTGALYSKTNGTNITFTLNGANGIMGSTQPGPAIYTANINDFTGTGNIRWQLVGNNNYAAFQCDTSCNELYVDQVDTIGPYISAFRFTNSLAGQAPELVHIIGGTVGGFVYPIKIESGSQIRFIGNEQDGCFQTGCAEVNIGPSTGSDIVFADTNTVGPFGTAYLINGGSQIRIHDSSIEQSPGGSGIGAEFTANASHVDFHDNHLVALTTGMKIDSGANDYLNLHHNDCDATTTTCFSNLGSSGTHNLVLNNIGYNPVGTSVTTATSSGSPYRAGPTPEDHLFTTGNLQTLTVPIGAGPSQTTICTGIPCPVHLEPNQVMTPTFSGTAPTDIKRIY